MQRFPNVNTYHPRLGATHMNTTIPRYEGTGLLAKEAIIAMTSPFTYRQQPVADKFEEQLTELASLAESINDNAWDESTPLSADVARHWMRRLDEVRTSLFNAQAAARGE
jgi:hypothetical protein